MTMSGMTNEDRNTRIASMKALGLSTRTANALACCELYPETTEDLRAMVRAKHKTVNISKNMQAVLAVFAGLRRVTHTCGECGGKYVRYEDV
jgi:hypothetical protein